MSRLRLAIAAGLLLAAAVVVVGSRLALVPPRSNIRWVPTLATPAQADAERALRLADGVPRSERTWSYHLLDTSAENVRAIYNHPAVEDRHYLGPGLVVSPEAPPLRAWFQSRYDRGIVRMLAAWGSIAAPLLVVLAMVIAWPALTVFVSRQDGRVLAIFVVAAAVRVCVAMAGGQRYWPDGGRRRGSASRYPGGSSTLCVAAGLKDSS